jgi:hypothetical protein
LLKGDPDQAREQSPQHQAHIIHQLFSSVVGPAAGVE